METGTPEQKLRLRLKGIDDRIAYLEDEIAHVYERHGHTNRDWAEDELRVREAQRKELITVALICGIDVRKREA